MVRAYGLRERSPITVVAQANPPGGPEIVLTASDFRLAVIRDAVRRGDCRTPLVESSHCPRQSAKLLCLLPIDSREERSTTSDRRQSNPCRRARSLATSVLLRRGSYCLNQAPCDWHGISRHFDAYALQIRRRTRRFDEYDLLHPKVGVPLLDRYRYARFARWPPAWKAARICPPTRPRLPPRRVKPAITVRDAGGGRPCPLAIIREQSDCRSLAFSAHSTEGTRRAETSA